MLKETFEMIGEDIKKINEQEGELKYVWKEDDLKWFMIERPLKRIWLVENMYLTEEDAKEIQKKYSIMNYDTEDNLKKKGEMYQKYKRNCKFMMDNFNLTAVDLNNISIHGNETEEELKEQYLKYKINCKFVMDNFDLTEEDLKQMRIHHDDTEEDLKKMAQKYLGEKEIKSSSLE